jgi:hypothetical protein
LQSSEPFFGFGFVLSEQELYKLYPFYVKENLISFDYAEDAAEYYSHFEHCIIQLNDENKNYFIGKVLPVNININELSKSEASYITFIELSIKSIWPYMPEDVKKSLPQSNLIATQKFL